MYEHQGLQDVFFIMLYGSVAMMAFLAGVYLVLRQNNALSPTIKSPYSLRCWAAAFLFAVTASHVWWCVLGIHWLTEDRLLRNIVAISLDRLTFVPLMMCTLMRMLQDRRRSLLPVAIAMVPFAVIAVVSIATHDQNYELYTEWYSLLLCFLFLIYFIFALRQYGRWLRDNFADLEHKEVWQSLVLFSFTLLVYLVYTTSGGALFTEYLAQIFTVFIVIFVVWRVETLQELQVAEASVPLVYAENNPDEMGENEQISSAVVLPDDIGKMLQKHCIKRKIYLTNDLTMTQLCEVVGTNRTYLGLYFAQQNVTYNTYINTLRIEHFVSLYHHAVESNRPFVTKNLVYQSGFKSYSTFAYAFKRIKGMSLQEWIKEQGAQ